MVAICFFIFIEFQSMNLWKLSALILSISLIDGLHKTTINFRKSLLFSKRINGSRLLALLLSK